MVGRLRIGVAMTVRVPISVTFHRLPSHLKVSPIFTSVRCIRFYVPSTIALIRSSILASPSCSLATSARSCLSSSSLISRVLVAGSGSSRFRDQVGDFMLALAAEGTIASTGHFRLIALDQVTDDRRQFTAQLFESFTFGVDAKQVAGFNKPALGLGIVIDIEFYHSANLPFDSIIAPAISEPYRAIFKSASGLPRTKMACGGRRGTGHGLLKTIAIPSKAAAATTATAHRINLRFSILISSVARFEWS